MDPKNSTSRSFLKTAIWSRFMAYRFELARSKIITKSALGREPPDVLNPPDAAQELLSEIRTRGLDSPSGDETRAIGTIRSRKMFEKSWVFWHTCTDQLML